MICCSYEAPYPNGRGNGFGRADGNVMSLGREVGFNSRFVTWTLDHFT